MTPEMPRPFAPGPECCTEGCSRRPYRGDLCKLHSDLARYLAASEAQRPGRGIKPIFPGTLLMPYR